MNSTSIDDDDVSDVAGGSPRHLRRRLAEMPPLVPVAAGARDHASTALVN